jgi:hypothetical protein
MNSKESRRPSNLRSIRIREATNDGYQPSTAFGDALSMYAGSGGGSEIVQNSYKLEPDRRFPVQEVQKVVEQVLKENLKNKKYEREKCSKLCPSLSRLIQDKAKSIGLQRYKLITVVLIGENKSQSARVASRCLWNENFDSYASASFYTETLFAQATVQGESKKTDTFDIQMNNKGVSFF